MSNNIAHNLVDFIECYLVLCANTRKITDVQVTSIYCIELKGSNSTIASRQLHPTPFWIDVFVIYHIKIAIFIPVRTLMNLSSMFHPDIRCKWAWNVSTSNVNVNVALYTYVWYSLRNARHDKRKTLCCVSCTICNRTNWYSCNLHAHQTLVQKLKQTRAHFQLDFDGYVWKWHT